MVDTKRRRISLKGRLGYESCHDRPSDTHKLSDAAKEFQGKLPAPSISELIMHFNGDKYKTSYELTRAKLGSQGTVEEYQKEYKNVLHDVNRYLKKTRTPSNEMKERFKKLYIPESKKPLKVRIKGCVKVSNEYYYKDLTNNPITVPSRDVNTFIKLAQEDNEKGYLYLNGRYMQSGISDDTFDWLDNVDINFSF